MANKDKYQNLGHDFLNDIWGKRDLGIPIPDVKWGPIRHQDVLYLLNNYPFLQIVNSEPDFVESHNVDFITSQSGWVIHDYGPAMSASPGEWLYGYYNTPTNDEDGDEGGGGAGLLAGKGTIVNQAFVTAQEMMALAMQKGWPGVEIVAGHELMQWAAWMWAEDYKYSLIGYEPDRTAKRKRERIRKMVGVSGETPTPSIGPRGGR